MPDIAKATARLTMMSICLGTTFMTTSIAADPDVRANSRTGARSVAEGPPRNPIKAKIVGGDKTTFEPRRPKGAMLLPKLKTGNTADYGVTGPRKDFAPLSESSDEHPELPPEKPNIPIDVPAIN